MKRRVVRVAALAILLLLLGVGTVKAGFLLAPKPPPGITLTDLASIQQLQSLFDAQQGTPRLLLVMSPT